jgi:hypothetical protein
LGFANIVFAVIVVWNTKIISHFFNLQNENHELHNFWDIYKLKSCIQQFCVHIIYFIDILFIGISPKVFPSSLSKSFKSFILIHLHILVQIFCFEEDIH